MTTADSGSRGVGAIASKFGETKISTHSTGGATSPIISYNNASGTSNAYGRARAADTSTNDDTSSRRIRDTTSTTSLDPPATRRTRTDTNSSIVPEATTARRTRDTTSAASTTDSPLRRTRNTITNDTTPSYSSSIRTRDTTSTLPRTRSRETTLTNNTFESPSTYTPKCRLNNYERTDTGTLDRSGYNSGYGSEAKSGYGSDYKSGITSGSKYQSYSRANSTSMKDPDTTYKSPYSRENSLYKPYSRENSYLGSDAAGSSWRSRVYGTENTETKPPDSSLNPNTTILNDKNDKDHKKESLDTTVFRDAIEKLTLAAKVETDESKKPDGLSPNAVRVLPIFSPTGVKLKNRAPADFTSASEGSDAEGEKESKTNNTANTTSTYRSNNKKEDILPPPTPGRAFRHLAAVAPLPSRSTSTTTGLIPAPTFKYSSRYTTEDTEALRATATTSKWLRDKDDSTTEVKINDLPSQVQNVSGVANKDCRKSVLNMDLSPADKELMRKQQEDKREELRKLRRLRGEDPKVTEIGKSPKLENAVVQRIRAAEADNNNLADEDDKQSSEESMNEKPPVPPSLEKTSSRTRLVERKHSRGKGDGLRSSGSLRRMRDRQSSQNSKTSSSSSSDEESESRLSKAKNTSFSRRRRGSRDDAVASSGDSRPSSRIRTESQSSNTNKRSRNNSESLSKTNSKNNILKSVTGINSKNSASEGDKSRSNSRNNLNGDIKLSIGPDIDIGESTFTFTIPNKAPKQTVSPSTGSITRTKEKKEAQSSSEEESSKSSESSESASEEGQFFSLSKSKSMKKSKSSFHKMPGVSKIEGAKDRLEELGMRTSPDGKENISRNNSTTNMKSVQCEDDDNGVVTAKVTITLPKKRNLQESASSPSIKNELDVPQVNGEISRSNSKNIICNASVDETYGEFNWPSGSPDLPKENISNEENKEFDTFQWPSGSPELPRRKVSPAVADTNGYGEFNWSNRSPVQPRGQEDNSNNEPDSAFQWPDGSPEMPRRKPNNLKAQWDTETETEMTDMEQTEWSNTRDHMPQVEEETEEEFIFEWPSSPEMSRRYPFATQNSGYDTQNEIDNFEWASSPELPVYKDSRYVTLTQNIDELINDEEKVEDDFDELEKLYGFEATTDDTDKTESSAKTSRRSSKCSERMLADGMTDDNKEEDDEDDDKDGDEEKHESKLEGSTKADCKKQSKESLKDRARNNLQVFLGNKNSIIFNNKLIILINNATLTLRT